MVIVGEAVKGMSYLREADNEQLRKPEINSWLLSFFCPLETSLMPVDVSLSFPSLFSPLEEKVNTAVY